MPAIASARTIAKKNFVPFSDKLTKSLEDVTKTIEDNKQTLDTIQELGINLSQTIKAISASALKYANLVNGILDSVLPILERLPILPPKTREFLKDLDAFADKFLASVQSAQKISGDVETRLVAGDVNALKAHSVDLQKVVASVKAIVPVK